MRDWNPVLKGDIYCSPACGFKCTKAGHDEAVRLADEMIDELGDGWEPDVWENCRWNYAAKHKKQDIRIHPNKYDTVDSYTCFYNGPVQKLGRGSTPTEAYMDSQRMMIEFSESVLESLENL